jgi:hypothetical protein
MDCERLGKPSSPAFTQGGFMAKIIEFYIPVSFKKKASKWIPPEQQGKVIEFGAPQKKSA